MARTLRPATARKARKRGSVEDAGRLTGVDANDRPRPTPVPEASQGGDPSGDASGDAPNGLVALGGRLDFETLVTAYRAGIFPWSSDPVLTWWSPDPRAIFDLDA